MREKASEDPAQGADYLASVGFTHSSTQLEKVGQTGSVCPFNYLLTIISEESDSTYAIGGLMLR